MKNKMIYLVGLAVVLLTVAGCSAGSSNQDKKKADSTGKIQVVATYSIIADMIENVGGDKVDVYSMVPVGTDPHIYDPTPRDTEAVEKSDIVFYNGLNLETGKGWFDKVITNSRKEDVTFAVSKGVEPMYLSEAGQETEEDPHAWLNVQNGIKYVENITDELSKISPENADYFQKNKEAYVAKLTELDTQAKEKMLSIPEENRILVSSEGAFKYFSKQYGLQAEYIWEINTDSQGTPGQMKRIVERIKNDDVKALFVETSISPKTMEAVSRETGVPIAAKIFTDSLADKGEDGDTYYDMIKWNIDKIYEGLSGKTN